jgi:hypothetical protein
MLCSMFKLTPDPRLGVTPCYIKHMGVSNLSINYAGHQQNSSHHTP